MGGIVSLSFLGTGIPVNFIIIHFLIGPEVIMMVY